MKREELQTKLQNFFIIGGGAWQALWEPEKPSKSMGFLPDEEKIIPKEITQETLQSSIRPELLRRFRAEVLIMKPMTEEDYKTLVPKFAKSLPKEIRKIFKELAYKGVEKAIEDNLNMRYFEETLTQSLVEYTKNTIDESYKDYVNQK